MNQPAEARRGVIEQVFMPEILDALDRHAANDGAYDLVLDVAREKAFGPDLQNKIRLMRRRSEQFEKRQIALVYIKQRIAVRAGDSLRFVRRDEIERAAAIWTAHSDGGDPFCFSLNRLCITESDLGKCYVAPEKNPRRIVAVIDGRKRVVLAREIRVRKFFPG